MLKIHPKKFEKALAKLNINQVIFSKASKIPYEEFSRLKSKKSKRKVTPVMAGRILNGFKEAYGVTYCNNELFVNIRLHN